MKKTTGILLTIVLLVSMFAGCGGGGGGDQSGSGTGDEATYKLRLSSHLPANNIQTLALQDAVKTISEKSDGRIEVTLYPDSQLGDYSVVYGQVMTGDIDMAVLSLATTYDDRVNALYLPYLTTSVEEYKQSYFPGGYVWDLVTEINEDLGCAYLGAFYLGYTGIGAAKLPDAGFAELTDKSISKDVLIRVPPIKVYAEVVPEMGFRTTTIPYADLYPALQSGVADGWIGGSALLNWDGFRDVINYFIDCRAVDDSNFAVINKKLLDSMSESDQKIIRDVFVDTAYRVADEYMQVEEKAMGDMEDIGIKIISPTAAEISALSARVRSAVWIKMTDEIGADLIEKLCEVYDVSL